MNWSKPITPVRTAAPYIGGKRMLAPRIIKRIEEHPHVTYAEPFVGMGGVFFRRKQRPKSEVINDLSGDITNFFRILQRHYAPFVEMLKYQVTSREEFERQRTVDPATLTDLERAARFIYLQRIGFGGIVAKRTYGVDVTNAARFMPSKVGPILEAIHERLEGVAIECLPYDRFIAKYDRSRTLFYLDPPYYGVEDYYGKALFHRDNFEKLADQLACIEGHFILSLNDTLEVREIFRDFLIEAVPVTYTAAANNNKAATELLISNIG